MFLFEHTPRWAVGIFLFFSLLLAYSNSFRNTFLMDDYGLILQDAKIHNIRLLPYQFIPDLKESLHLENQRQDPYYRPFATVLPMLGWAFFKENPVGYHILNFLLFFLAVLAIYAMIECLLDDRRLAFLVAFLFCLHPINGLMINYSTASVFALQILALACAMLFFWKAYEAKHPVGMIGLSLLGYVTGLLCHESSFALPLYLTAGVLILKKRLLRKDILYLSLFFILSGVYFLFRLYYASLAAHVFTPLKQVSLNPAAWAASEIRLFLIYLWQFFSFQGIFLQTTIVPVSSGYLFWFGSFFAVLGLGVYWALRRNTVLLWGYTIFLLGFLPVFFGSTFQMHYGFTLEPHWLFFPSLGLFVLIGAFLLQVYARLPKIIFWIMLGLLALSMGFYDRSRNKLWGNELAYTRAWVAHSPTQKGAQFYYAAALAKAGRTKEAETVYTKALEGSFKDWQVYTNLGLMAQKEGDRAKAERYFQKAYRIFPKSAVVNNDLGMLRQEEGKTKEAEKYFQRALHSNPYVPEPYMNLAALYAWQHDYARALALYRRGEKFLPQNPGFSFGELEMLIRMQARGEVGVLWQKIRRRPFSSDFFNKSAVLLAQNGYNSLALEAFEKALKTDPRNLNVYIDLGKFFANTGRPENAQAVWSQGLKIDPANRLLRDLLSHLPKEPLS